MNQSVKFLEPQDFICYVQWVIYLFVNKRIILFFYIYNIYNLVYTYMLTNLIKPYGILYLPEDKIEFVLYFYPFLNGLFRPMWGFFCDLLGFKKVYFLMLIMTVDNII
jgi:hypothetical protein